MEILIISTFFPPVQSIASLRPYSWAKGWAEEGHRVTVLTVQPVENGAPTLQLPNLGIQVIEVPLPSFLNRWKSGYQKESTPSKSFIKNAFQALRTKTGCFNACRMPDFTDFWVSPALKAVRPHGPWDVIISTAGPYTVHRVGHALKKEGLTQSWIADYRDLWSQNHIYPGVFPFNWMEPYLERKLLRQADGITTVSTQLGKDFEHPQVEVIENGFDPEDLKTVSDAKAFPPDGKVRLVYTGTLYPGKQNVRPLLQAIRALKGSPLLDALEVVFVGDGFVQDREVEKWVRVRKSVPREEALRMQRDAFALLFFPWNDPQVDGILTGKLFEYLFSKTPILAIGAEKKEASQRLILEAKAGRLLPDASAIEDYLVAALRSRTKEKSMVNASVIDRFHRKTLARKLLHFIQNLKKM